MSATASNVRYEAHPSLIRMRPFATLLAIVLMLLGILIAVSGWGLLPASLAQLVTWIDERLVQAAGILLFALSALQLLVWWVATRTDVLKITDDEILWTHGLVNKKYTELGMGSVRTVQVSQSLLQRLLDAGDIRVFTTGDLPELVVRGLPEPSRIRELVKARGTGMAAEANRVG
ncbi:MAG: PH domain-containing protein [Bdellovibrio bacteriovorus]